MIKTKKIILIITVNETCSNMAIFFPLMLCSLFPQGLTFFVIVPFPLSSVTVPQYSFAFQDLGIWQEHRSFSCSSV